VKIVAALLATIVTAAAMSAGGQDRQQQPPLIETIQSQIADRHGVDWSATRKLTWDDFTGAVVNADLGEAAHLEYGLFYGVRCTGRTLQFHVINAMIPGDSWVLPSVISSPADNARTLQHEQTHFDLAEVHARKMEKYFAGLYEPCLRSNEDLAALADGLIKTQSAEQKRYDDETRNGRRADAQKRWDADVASRLNGR
jgi:uncharacterized protein DUF922